MQKKPFVLIVGAGPVGLTLAIECHRHGVPFRIIDRNISHSDKSKALALWSGTLECLAAMGVIEEFLNVSQPIRHFIFADHGKILNTIPASSGIDSPYPTPMVLPQSHTEQILEHHLQALGITIERGIELRSFSQDEEKVTVEFINTNGSHEIVEAAYLAGCDGAKSIIRHGLPVQFQGETESLGFVLIDAKVEGDLPCDAMLTSWGADITTTFFPVKPGVFRMFTERKDLTDHTPPTLEEMQNYLSLTGLGHLRFYEPEWLSYFGINERVASRNRVNRVFLLGDAAHIHSPAGGQGMNTGIQDAFNLGWKLGLLSQGMGDPEMIAESYFQERHPVAKTLVEETTKLLHAGITNSPLARIAKDFFAAVLLRTPTLQRMLSGKLSEMNIHYVQSDLIEHDSLSADDRKYQAGWRTYDAEVICDETKEPVSLWNYFLHSHHTLLIFSGKHFSEDTSDLLLNLLANKHLDETKTRSLIVWKDYLTLPDVNAFNFLDKEALAHDHFGISEPSWLLIRPDLYVAARGSLNEQERLMSYLKKINLSK